MRVNTFLVARFIVFGLFTICNAIICSVAAWNLGLVQAAKPQQVDAYLIFLGAFSLVSIFTLMFVELLRIRPLTTRVWFECAWVTLFWVMQLAGGAALIAIDSNLSCPPNTTESIHALCTSERVLLAFTWICAIILLIYLLVLVFLAASQSHADLDIWGSDIHTLQLSTVQQTYAAVQPTIVRTKRTDVDMHTRRSPRSRPTQNTQHHGGLSSKYDIEPFRPVFAAPEQMDTSHSNLPEAIPLPLLADPAILSSKAIPQGAENALAVSLGLYDMPRERVPSSSYPGPSPQTHVPRKQSVSLPAPSPLGDWPRQDIMKQPVNPKKSKPPPSAYEFPGSHVGGSDVPNTNPQRPRRPSGPRLRVPSVESGHQPAAPDFYPGASASHIASEVVR